MRIWKNECVKVWFSPAFWLVLAVLLIINGTLLYTKAPDVMLDASSYRNTYDYFLNFSDAERFEEVKKRYDELERLLFREVVDETWFTEIEEYKPQFTQDAYQEHRLMQEFEKQMADIAGYEVYLNDIQERAKGQNSIAIFRDKSRFSGENAQKTADAFAPLASTKPVFVNSHTFHETVDFPGTDFLVVCLLFYMVAMLVVWERERGLTELLFPLLRGRHHLITAKMSVLFCGSVLPICCSGA